jgi:fatty-acyl-CoA synthase
MKFVEMIFQPYYCVSTAFERSRSQLFNTFSYSGGENIFSIEVEDALYKHPAVQAAAVVAKPDDKWGETPCAFVELKPGASATSEDLVAWCRRNLAAYKCPRYVVFAEIPKTSTGKIQKFKLREMAKAV